jgi:hypothetical protein
MARGTRTETRRVMGRQGPETTQATMVQKAMVAMITDTIAKVTAHKTHQDVVHPLTTMKVSGTEKR